MAGCVFTQTALQIAERTTMIIGNLVFFCLVSLQCTGTFFQLHIKQCAKKRIFLFKMVCGFHLSPVASAGGAAEGQRGLWKADPARKPAERAQAQGVVPKRNQELMWLGLPVPFSVSKPFSAAKPTSRARP